MSERVDVIVIGAGVIGLAVARQLAMLGREVIIVEANSAIGMGTSSRNSEVIHAGIYYPNDSLKARLCVEGKKQLYSYCQSHKIPHKRLGKLIVASSAAQVNKLKSIQENAKRNGVDDLRLLDNAAVKELEPDLSVEAALLSPSTGIIDTHAYMLALLSDAEQHGAMLALNSPVLSASLENDMITLSVGGEMPMNVSANVVVNSAGLHAIPLAQAFNGLAKDRIPKAYYCKGNYFSLSYKTRFSHLIYPVPEDAGLGVHLTLDMGGQARFGPDVEWLEVTSPDDIDYEVDAARGNKFYSAIRTYWPDLKEGTLNADYSGVRPKIQRPGEIARDFCIQGPAQHAIPGLVNLFGIESPGLTASLAIAAEVQISLNL
jgi:L-2-hydroxyglutarate oxidase LhgO